jgi:hypothetical protein
MQEPQDIHESLSGICFGIKIKEAFLLQLEKLKKLSTDANRSEYFEFWLLPRIIGPLL